MHTSIANLRGEMSIPDSRLEMEKGFVDKVSFRLERCWTYRLLLAAVLTVMAHSFKWI